MSSMAWPRATEIHKVKLKHDFPDLRFVVEFNDEPGLEFADYSNEFLAGRRL